MAYLVAVGLLFLGLTTARIVSSIRTPGPPDAGSVVLLGTNVFLAVTLISIGSWLYSGSLSDEHTLAVSTWGAIGLTLPTVLVVAAAVVFDVRLGGGTDQLTAAFATGGVIGSLYGSISALEDEHGRVTSLYQRNQVLQRVFRHNIRNSMNVVEGYADLLSRNADDEGNELAGTIQREARSIVDLADVARNLDTIEEERNHEPVDLVAVVTELLDTLGRHYPDATFETDLPDSAWVAADGSVEIAVWHLVEFAIHRSSGSPVSITLTAGDGENVALTVADDSDDLPAGAITVLENSGETPLEHPDGMDLWLVKWLVESLGGEMTVDRPGSSGARVTLVFEPRSPDAAGGR